jgi:hypothetical protein
MTLQLERCGVQSKTLTGPLAESSPCLHQSCHVPPNAGCAWKNTSVTFAVSCPNARGRLKLLEPSGAHRWTQYLIENSEYYNRERLLKRNKSSKTPFLHLQVCRSINTLRPPTSARTRRTLRFFYYFMAVRHPWFSQTLKRKHTDDSVSEGGNGCGSGGGAGFGVIGTMYGGLDAFDAHGVGQTSSPNQGSNSNGRATKRVRNSRVGTNGIRGTVHPTNTPHLFSPAHPTTATTTGHASRRGWRVE